MDIKYAIVSSDENPMYMEFWPIVKSLWIRIGIKPLLVLISDRDEVTDYGDCIIHCIKSVSGISTAFQSQISRMYVTKYYEDEVCITSDIDMLPLSIEFFNNCARDFDLNDLVILSSDAYNPLDRRYPICYNVATGKTFSDVLKLDCSFDEYCHRLHSYDQKWDTDELYFGKCVLEFDEPDRIIRLSRGWPNGMASRRIDRVYWNYDPNLIKVGYYIDSHSLRPYFKYKQYIDKMISYL